MISDLYDAPFPRWERIVDEHEAECEVYGLLGAM